MRTLTALILLTVFVFFAPLSAAADADRTGADACRDLIVDYAWYWDHNNHKEFASLFTMDADFQAAGRVHKGRDAIFEAQSKRTGKVVTRMFFTNIRTVVTDADTIEASSYLMVHSEPVPAQAEGEASGPPATIPTRGFRIIGEMAFTCASTDDGWKISSVDLTPVFNDENLED